MPRKKTEELAIIVPETPVLPPATKDAADQPLVGNTVPENTTEPAAAEIEPVEEAKAESAEYPVQELSTPAAGGGTGERATCRNTAQAYYAQESGSQESTRDRG